MEELNNSHTNPLYPIFLKLHKLRMLIVGAGEVGYEKLFFILKSSPDARITVVATWTSEEVEELVARHPSVTLHIKPFEVYDVENKDLVIAATNDSALNVQVREAAKARDILVNVADTPDLCDFYLGSIVTRGPLKLGISTNGQSPTFAKRFRQMLEDILPESTETLIENLYQFRNQLKGDFTHKVRQLNELTESLIEKRHK